MVQPHREDMQPCLEDKAKRAGNVIVIPEIEEIASISTRTVETGTVRITKHLREVERTFEPHLREEQVHVERVPIDRLVEQAPEIRREGDTTVYPVVEEVLVKMLLVKEEVRVTRKTVDKASAPHAVTLRREEVEVERIDAQVGGYGKTQ